MYLNLGQEAHVCTLKCTQEDFPGGSVVKNLPASAGDMGLIPRQGRLHMPRGNQVSVPQLLKPALPRGRVQQQEVNIMRSLSTATRE